MVNPYKLNKFIFYSIIIITLLSPLITYSSIRVEVHNVLEEYGFKDVTYRYLNTAFIVEWIPLVNNVTSCSIDVRAPGLKVIEVARINDYSWRVLGYFTNNTPIGYINVTFKVSYSWISSNETFNGVDEVNYTLHVIPRLIRLLIAYVNDSRIYIYNPEGELFHEQGQIIIPIVKVKVNNMEYTLLNIRRGEKRFVTNLPRRGANVTILVDDDYNGTISFNYLLDFKFKVRVKVVRDLDKQPLSNVNVTVYSREGVSNNLTDSSGVAEFHLSPGLVLFNASINGRFRTKILRLDKSMNITLELDYTPPQVKVLREGYPLTLNISDESFPVLVIGPENHKYTILGPGVHYVYIPYEGRASIIVADRWGNNVTLNVLLNKPEDKTIYHVLIAVTLSLIVATLISLILGRTPREW